MEWDSFFSIQNPDESFSAKWKDEKGVEHVTQLPDIKNRWRSATGSHCGQKTKFFNNPGSTIVSRA